MIVAVVVGVSALLLGGYFLFFRQDYAVLYRDLRPISASAIVQELKKERVSYRLSNGGADILVPVADLDSVRLAVTGADLTSGLNGFELFDNSDMGLTDFAQKIKFQRALQGELTRTILLIDGVADARVHLSLPEKSLFRSEAASAKASVTLLTKSREPFSKAEIEGIQQLVASAIPELQSQDVVVLSGGGEVVSAPAQPPAPPAVETEPAPAEEQTVETKLASLLQQALPTTAFQLHMEEATPAPQPVNVAESADASPETAEALEASVVPPASARLHITTTKALSEKEQELVRSAIGDSRLVPANTALKFAEGPVQDAREIPAASSTAMLPVAVDEPAAPVPVAVQQAAPSTSAPDGSVILIAAGSIAAVAIAFAVAIGLFFARHPARARPALALEDHSRFAERLKAGLAQEQEATHAA
jgi:flagellar M-ring protein FliF